MIKFHKIHQDAKFPTRATEGSAGFDLYCLKDFGLLPGSKVLVPTGISTEFSSDYCGQIWPRSGLANKYGVEASFRKIDQNNESDAILGGLIDSDYRGEIGVILFCNNHTTSTQPVEFREGDRIAQIVFVNVTTDFTIGGGGISETTRGIDGFGSTGS